MDYYYFAVGPLVRLVGSSGGPDLELRLSHDLRIRHMLADDIRLNPMEEPFYNGVAYVVEFLKGPFNERPEVFDRNLEAPARKAFDDVITSLRLFSGDVVYCPFIEFRSVTEKIDIWKRLKDLKALPGYSFIKPVWLKQAFLEFWKFYVSVDQPDRLRRAIHRFNVAIEKQPVADSLLDCFIGLESIILDDNIELTHKLSSRGATLLAEVEERGDVFKELKAGYRIRSLITHGKSWTDEKVRGEKVNIERLIGVILSYLRASILAYLQFEKSKISGKQFDPEDLDAVLLGDPWLVGLSNAIRNFHRTIVICPTCLAATEKAYLYCTVCGHILVSP